MQSLSTWTHAQLTAFGTRIWMGKEKSPETVIKNTGITQKISTHFVMSNIYKGEDESFSSKFDKIDAIQKQISEADTMSEVSHTLAYDGSEDENHLHIRESQQVETKAMNLDPNEIDNKQKPYTKENSPMAVKAIIRAQDIIDKTQKEHFDNLLTVIGNSDVHV